MATIEIRSHYKVRGRIWIETDEGAFLGSGRIELLKRVKDLGSITKAAKSMKMSYRQAWELIDSINKKSTRPFVIKQSGGIGGGGAVLTEAGENAINEFNKLNEEFFQFLEAKSKKLTL